MAKTPLKGPPPKYKKRPVRPTGAPSKYDPAYHPQQAYKYGLLGCDDKTMAELFGISEATFHNWKKHKEFLESIRKSKDYADADVALALRDRALGYVCTTEQAFKVKKGKDHEVVEVVTLKQQVPPDTKAATIWLSNRQRKYWKDRQTVEVEGADVLVNEINAARDRLNNLDNQK